MPDQMFAGHFTGQPWRHKIDGAALAAIPELQAVDPSPEAVANGWISAEEFAAHVAAVRATAEPAAAWLALVGESLTDEEIQEFAETMAAADRVYEVEETWEAFYDYADRARIWISPPGSS